MEEGTKVRLVRCPKCENLLPELPNLAVYQCGGCGVVLQAKKRPNSSDGCSEKSDDERVRVSTGKQVSVPQEGEAVDVSDALEFSDRESNGVKFREGRRERPLPSGATADSTSSSLSRIENKVVNENITATSKYDGGRSVELGNEGSDKYRRASKDPVDSWDVGNDHDMNKSWNKSVRSNMKKEIGEFDPQMGGSSGTTSSEQVSNWRSGERDGYSAYRRTPRAVAEDVRFSRTPYPDEGTSSYNGSYGLAQQNQNISDGPNKVEHLEQDRAELLRKLDELKDQLAKTCDISDKTKERVPLDGRTVPVDPYVGRDTWFPEGSSRQHRPTMPPFQADKHAQRPLYSNHALEHVPLMNRHGLDMQNFYSPLMHAPNEVPGYGDPFAPQMIVPNQPPHQYLHHPSHDYFPAQYMDMDPDHNASYPTNTFFHQPACSCFQCYNKHWHIPSQVPPGVLHNRRFVDVPPNPLFYNVESRGTFGPRGYNPRDSTPVPTRSHEPQPLSRRQRDLDTEPKGLGQSRPRRVALAKRSGRRCCPIAGGAPFITCHNCFELLPLPRKLLHMEKNQRKLRCGNCSTIITFLFESKRVIVSSPSQTNVVPSLVNERSVPIEKGLLQPDGQENRRESTYSSDFDNSGYNFQLTDTEPGSTSMDRRLHLSESEKLQGLVSSSYTTSDDEESPGNVIARREVSSSAELRLKASGTPPVPGSPLREYTSSNQVVNKFEKGNRSKRTHQEEVFLTKATSRQNSVKDASMATEMDVSFNEYSNATMSQDSGEVSKEDHPRVSKGGESFFVGLIKKSLKDFSKSNETGENEKCNFLVNGQHISGKLVKKAEKYAGRIHPGQYWYDYRAGFWGLMGQPCLGIIPPFIEEFNYPMPENCAGGNTGVFVNGRELHQKDLDLLANRGLPTAPDRCYLVEISGRVLDEESGEELDNLGKLAPT
ncbi:hypothetical protein IFM89_021370 [Coptis chinensis]|uniref:Zinc-ribbon domain-containing protein n=1 Tax=Coptis chinensis TaxID=261450 RepID=A0A835IBF1_9MAGN|nr:hypothetical protein IFM89_021370 [Coptis chinensis]